MSKNLPNPNPFLLKLFVLLLAIGGIFSLSAQTISNITVSGTPVCAGATVSVSFDVSNGASPAYFDNATAFQLYLSNGTGTSFTPQGSTFTLAGPFSTTDGGVTNLTYSFTIPATTLTGSGYKIAIGSSSPTVDGSTGANASTGFTVNALPILGSVTANTVCEGTPATVNLTGLTPSSAFSIDYTINGAPYTAIVNSDASGLSSFNTPALAATDNGKTLQISGITNTAATCSQAFTKNVVLTVNPSVVPGVSIVATDPAPATLTPSVCPGTNVTFSATPSNGGAPSYQWKLNGIDAGINSDTYTAAALTDGDVVSVVMTSDVNCASTPTATSNTIAVQVKPGPPAGTPVISGNIAICPATTNTYSVTPVADATSYFWSIPAGWSVSGANNGSSINLTAGSNGGNISVIALNDCGNSSAGSLAVTVSPAQPATPGAITGTFTVCPGTSQSYSIAAVANASSYNWQVPTGWTITANTGTAITVTAGTTGQNGSIKVSATNNCGTSSLRSHSLTVQAGAPATPGAISGTAELCTGTTGTFNISNVANATSYTWTVPTGWSIVSGQGSNAISVQAGAYTQDGNITVTATNACGTSTASTIPVTVKPPTPAQPGTITGTATQCPGVTSQVYSITGVTNATNYTWLVPTGWTITSGQGGTSINVTTGSTGQNGNISVTAENDCGVSSSRTLGVTVGNGTPSTPGTITASKTNVCINSTNVATFSVPAVTNATGYNWNLPSGWTISSGANTNSITVSTNGSAAAGNITVTASNACGTSAASAPVAVSVTTAKPATPGTISGFTAICPVRNPVYSISSVAGATSYTWSIPNTGWSITSGQGTTSASTAVAIGASSGNLSVTADNACGSSTASILAISVSNSVILDAGPDQTVCQGTGTALVNGTVGGAINRKSEWSIVTPTGQVGSFTNTSSGANDPVGTYSIPSNFSGTLSVILTTNQTAVGCGASPIRDTMLIKVLPNPITGVSIAGTTSICSGNTSNVTFTAPANTTVTYNVSGGVNQSGQTINIGSSGSAVLTTPALTANTTYTITSVAYSALNTCTTNITGQSATITVTPPATVSAGVNQTICSGSTVTLNGSRGGSATGATWSGGTGNFSPNANTLNAIYTPSASEVAAGSVTLTLTTSGPCASVSSQMMIAINKAATVSLGSIATPVCQGSVFNLSGTVGGGATTGTWTASAGGGSFANASQLTTTYTPATSFNGAITFTLTTNDPDGAGPCTAANAPITVNVNQAATATAGTAQTVCSGGTITLNGSVGGSATTGTWSSNNGGTFSNASSLTSTYSPSVTTGTVTLTLTSNDPDGAGPCSQAVSTVDITVNQAPTVTAGGPDEICQSPITVAFSLSGATIGGGATTGTWSIISGGGTLSNSSATANPASVTYRPVANATGQVVLQLSSNVPTGCTIVSEQRIVNINPAAQVDAGANQTICSNVTAVMSATIGGGASSGTWTTSGSGTFDNNSVAAVYTPSAADKLAGSVIITYTTDDPAGACTAKNDNLTLSIKKEPVINTQPVNQAACASSPVQLKVQASGDNLTYQWYKGAIGSGVAVIGATSATYNISSVQTGNEGSYYVVVGNANCTPINSNQVALVVSEPILITQQPSGSTICQEGSTTLTVSADAGGDPLTYQWYKGTPGSGTAVADGGNINGATTATLSIANALLTDAGSYYAIVTGPAGYTCATVTTAKATITVNPKPYITTTQATTVCSGTGFTVSPANGGGNVIPAGTKYSWSLPTLSSGLTGGSASAAGGATNIAGTINNTGNADGTAIYTVTPTSGSCPGADFTVTITVSPKPVIANKTTSICGGGSFSVAPTDGTDIVPTGTTYSWSAPSVSSGIGGGAAGSGSTIAGTLTNTNNTAGTATYTVTPTAGSCPGATFTVTVTVNPTPKVTTTQTASACSGTAFSVTPANGGGNIVPSGISYAWSAPSVPASINGGAAGSGSSIGGTLSNSANAAVTATYTVTPTAGSCTGSDFTVAVTVNPKPSITDKAISICSGSGFSFTPANTTDGVVPSGTTYSWSAPSISGGLTSGAAGSNAGSISGTLTNPGNTTGTATYTVTPTSGSCAGSIFTVTVTVNPKPSIANQTVAICTGTGFTVAPANGGGNIVPSGTTYSWSAPSITGSMTGGVAGSNASSVTGTLTNPTGSAQTATYTVTPTAGSCSGSAFTVSVTVNPNTTISLTSGSANPTLCNTTTMSAITYTVSGTANTPTVTGLPAGITSTYNTGTKVLTISGTPTTAGTYPYSIGVTGTCSSPTVNGTITVNPSAVGGATARTTGTPFVCANDNSGVVTLSGQSGNVVKWQKSLDNGATWTDISNTGTSQSFTNLPQTTTFRAVIATTACPTLLAYSTSTVVSVVPKTGSGSLSAFASRTVICEGSSTLTAIGFGADSTVGFLSGGDFDNAGTSLDGPGRWRKIVNGVVTNIEASTNNTENSPFNLTNGPKTFLNASPCTPITYSNDPLNGQSNNNKFMAVVGPNISTLETPIFNLVGLTSASIDWFEAYILQAGGSIKTEISLDGGATYNSLLRPTISGATTYGSPTNFKKTSIDLSAYIGLSNLRIRFTYTGTTCSSWGLEMATITKGSVPSSYTWNLASPMPVNGTPPGHYLNTFTDSTVTVTPPSPNNTNAPIVYDYSFSSSAGGCISDITITVNPILKTTATTPTQTVCSGTAISPITFNSNLPSTTFSWTRNNTTSVTGIAASGTGTVSGTLTNTTNVQQTVTFTINPSAPNSCGAASFTSTVILNPKIPVTLSGGGTICGSQSATLTLTSAGPYPVPVTLSNGVTYSITASPMNILVKPAGTTTYSISSLGNNNCATLSGSGTATVTVISTTGTTGTWLCGAGDGDWFNPCNWANAIVPNITTDVIIGSAASCNPVINPNSPYAATNGPVAYAKNITISGAKNLSFQNGGQLDVAGNWDNQVGVAGFTANTGTVRFVGSTAQSIKTTGSTETFYNMVIANTSPANAGVTLLSDVRVNNTLTLNTGIVNTKSVPATGPANGLGLLTLGVNATPVAGSPGAGSFINGQLAKDFNTAGVASEYLYPVGKIVGGVPTYKAMAVQPTSVAGTSTFTAEYFPSAHPNPTTVLDLFLLGFVPEYWQVDRTGGTADARIKIPYQNPGGGKWLSTNNAQTADPCATCNVAVVNKANDIWTFTKPSGGFSTTDPETRSYQDNGFIYSGSMSSFGPFTSGYAYNVILPLKLITFTGTVDQGLAKIKWSIEHPEELSEFELQASTDGRSFSQVATIPPGNGGAAFSYDYAGLRPGSNYFRLLVKGKNGNNFFSKTIMLVSNSHITVIKGIQPTMVKTETFILVNSISSQMINAKVLDVAGRPVSFYKGSIVQGENKCRVNTLMLLPGVYTIHIETADGVIANLRFVKE